MNDQAQHDASIINEYYTPKICFHETISLWINDKWETHNFWLNMYFEKEYIDQIYTEIMQFLAWHIIEPRFKTLINKVDEVEYKIHETQKKGEPGRHSGFTHHSLVYFPLRQIDLDIKYNKKIITNPACFTVGGALRDHIKKIKILVPFENYLRTTRSYGPWDQNLPQENLI